MAVETVEQANELTQDQYDAMTWAEYEALSDEVRGVVDKRVADGELVDHDAELVQSGLKKLDEGAALSAAEIRAIEDAGIVEAEEVDDDVAFAG